MTALFCGLMEEVRVMLVDPDKEFTKMVDLLGSHGYKVTTVDMAPAAISMLSKGNEKIDVMIINVPSPDSLCFKLLKQAVSLDIVTLLVCDDHNELFAKKAFDDGAYFYMKKPLDEEIVKYLWQFVLRKKIQREKARKENGDQMSVDDIGNNNNIFGDKQQVGERNMPINTEEQSNNIHEVENDIVSNGEYKLGRKRGRKSTKEINEGERKSSASNKTVRRKDCIKWTVDLQVKFTEAMQQLGDGCCLPKEILKVMNVPGLTRKQVASYLQRCRSNNCRAPEEQKHIRQGSSSGSQQRSSFTKFGRMPDLQTNVSNQTQRGPKFGRIPHLQTNVPNQNQIRPEFQAINTNNIFASSTQQQLYRPQLQVQPHYLNPFLSAQNNTGGGLQKHHGPLFGSQDPIIGSTNDRPCLVFNGGDHHDYNLDLNEAHLTTYSGSAMISNTNVGNATINGLGETNTNFQQYIGEQNMPDPSNVVAASNGNNIEGSDSNEKENCDMYFNFNDYLFQDLEPPGATLPDVYSSEFDQVNSDDQVAAIESVHFPGTANFPNESST